MRRSVIAAFSCAILAACSGIEPLSRTPDYAPTGSVALDPAPAASGQPKPSQANAWDRLTLMSQPQLLAWYDCALGGAIKPLRSNQAADVVARTALAGCHSQEAEFQRTIATDGVSARAPQQVVETRKREIRDKIVAIVNRNRNTLIFAERMSRSWMDCLVNAAPPQAISYRDTTEMLKGTFLACREREEAMRFQLREILDTADAAVEERKLRLRPMLAKYLDALQSNTGQAIRPLLEI